MWNLYRVSDFPKIMLIRASLFKSLFFFISSSFLCPPTTRFPRNTKVISGGSNHRTVIQKLIQLCLFSQWAWGSLKLIYGLPQKIWVGDVRVLAHSACNCGFAYNFAYNATRIPNAPKNITPHLDAQPSLLSGQSHMWLKVHISISSSNYPLCSLVREEYTFLIKAEILI